MSFFSKLLTVAGAVVGIAAAVATGGALGFLAAGLIGLGAASSLGIIGGSVGKFFNSGVGRGLVLAAGAYAAIGSFASGMSAASANATEGQQALNATNATTATVSDSAAAALPPPLASAADGANTADLGGALQGGMPATPGVDAASVQTANQAQNQIASAVNPEGNAMPGMSNETSPPNLSAPTQAQAAQGAVAPESTGPTPLVGQGAGSAPIGVADNSLAAAQSGGGGGYLNAAGNGAAPNFAGPPNAAGAGKGFFGLGDRTSAALLTAGGSALGGLGQGIAQKQAMEEQIRASQWANNRWTTPSLSGAAANASLGQINAPAGYLQRAAATRGLMANSTVPYAPPTAGPVPVGALPGVPPVPGPVH
jgi:hypothetical protein